MPDAEVAHEGYPHANAKPREPDTQVRAPTADRITEGMVSTHRFWE